MRSAPWYCVVTRAIAQRWGIDIQTLNPNGVRNLLEERAERSEGLTLSAGAWRRYQLGERLPAKETIAAIEKMFPGTSEVLEYGPGRSYLWTALRAEPNAALEAIAREWCTGVVVRPAEFAAGRSVDYRVVPKTIATKHGLPDNARGFPKVDVRKLLEPWQEIDEYLGRWGSIHCPLPGRRALFLGPEPEPSFYRARFGAQNSNNAVELPALTSMSYDIAYARCFDQRAPINSSLLAPYGLTLAALSQGLAEPPRS